MPIIVRYQDQPEIIHDIDPELAERLFEDAKKDPKNASIADQMQSTLINTKIEGKIVQAQEFKFPTKDSQNLFLLSVMFKKGKSKNRGNDQVDHDHNDKVSEDSFIVSHNGQHKVIQNFPRKIAEKLFNQMKNLPNNANIWSQMQCPLIPSPKQGIKVQQFNFPTKDSRDLFLELVATGKKSEQHQTVTNAKGSEVTMAMRNHLKETKSSETTNPETSVHRPK